MNKGADLGMAGRIGSSSCHLHHELRDQCHPVPSDADHYSSRTAQADVGGRNQEPFPFHDARRCALWTSWVDERSIAFTGAWTSASGVGGENGLYRACTPSSTPTTYARYTFAGPSTGTYDVWTFVPWNHGTSTAARYRRYVRNGSHVIGPITINRNAYYDAWRRVGTTALTGGITGVLDAATNTGEASKKVADGDFLIIKISNAI